LGQAPTQLSGARIKALGSILLLQHPEERGVDLPHAWWGVILRSYSTKPDEEMDTDDLGGTTKEGSQQPTDGLPPRVSIYDFQGHPKEAIIGRLDDWLYDHFGMLRFTVESLGFAW